MPAHEKLTITICMGSSCFSRGNNVHLQLITTYLQQHNLDAVVELAGSRCEGKCMEGPNLRIGGTMYHGINAEKLIALLDERVRNRESSS